MWSNVSAHVEEKLISEVSWFRKSSFQIFYIYNRSVDELGDCITKLTEKGEAENYQIVEQTQGDGELESDEVAVSSPFISEEGPILRPKPQLLGERSQVSGSKHKSKKGGWKGAGSRMVEKEVVEQEGGCFLCGLDNDYQNVSL